MTNPKTFSQKPADVTRKWHVIDATTAPIGRIATEAASLLLGKGKPSMTSHVDGGDYVIIINTDNLVATGNKLDNKMYYRHSGFPGGLKQATLKEVMDKDSTQVFKKAIRGMLPANKLRDGRLARLKVYAGAEHNHAAQAPQSYIVTMAKSRNNVKKDDK
ncbi:50S ribosomal protein L13 [Candidatus Saccharibacteria bacterium]|nr:50S ribosomal protein L13 [Candidatus Saccharibacteria bacterium]